MINRIALDTGNCLIGVEILGSTKASLPVQRKGQIKLNLRWGTALDENIVVVCLLQYSSLLTIDEHKQVLIQ